MEDDDMKVKELIEYLMGLPQDMTVVVEAPWDCYMIYDTFDGSSKIVDVVLSDRGTYDDYDDYNEWTKEKHKDDAEKVICIS